MVASGTKCVGNPRDIYQWIWNVTKVQSKPKEQVPMSEGDRIIVCISDEGKVTYKHRTIRDPKNTALWDNACAIICEQTGVIVGSFPDGRTFKMTLEQGEHGTQIRCNHRRNPDEGDWYGDMGGSPV